MSAPYLGDYAANSTVHFLWATNGADGASITRSTNGTVQVYKNNDNTGEVTTGVTDTEDFDGLTGIHACTIATTDAFYATGKNYTVVLNGAVIDGQTVNSVLAHFSIQNRVVTGSAPTAATVAAAVWDEALAGHSTAGTAGKKLTDIPTMTYSVPTAAATADAVWDELTSGHAVSGSFGELVGNIATGTPPTAAAIADAVWEEAVADHSNSGTFGDQVANIATGTPPSAASVADAVWDEALSGHSTAGSAGKKLTDIPTTTYTVPTAAQNADAIWDEALSGHLTAGTTGEALSNANAAGTPPTAAAIADAVWDELMSGHTTPDTFGMLLDAIFTSDLSDFDTNAADRSMLNALRFIRNKWTTSGGTLTVMKEDDATTAWTADLVRSTGASPIVSVDPAGP